MCAADGTVAGVAVDVGLAGEFQVAALSGLDESEDAVAHDERLRRSAEVGGSKDRCGGWRVQ